MKTARTIPFKSLPSDYAALCRLHLPRPIHDQTGYRNALEIAEAFAGFEASMTRDQHDYFDLLGKLIADHEASRLIKKKPLFLLRHLLKEHGMSGADLSRLLGTSRTLGPMILREQRSITIAHARILGSRFGLPTAAFVD